MYIVVGDEVFALLGSCWLVNMCKCTGGQPGRCAPCVFAFKQNFLVLLG